MTSPGRFATPPVVVPSRAARPAPLRRDITDTLWISAGQALIAFWMIFGFGARTEGPTTVLLIISGLGTAMLLLAPRGTVSQIRISVPIVLLSLWWACSYRWTTNQGWFWVSTKGEFGEIVPPILVASVLPIERITQAMRWSYYGVILLTLGATAANPGSTTTHLDLTGRSVLAGWHGTFIHKNDMVFFLLLGLVTVLVFEPRRWLRISSTVVTLALTMLSRSGTGAIAFTLLMILHQWMEAHRNQPTYLRRWFAGVSLFLGAGLVALLIPLTPVLLSLGGKDSTGSGRTEIWAASIAALRPHIWTGFGIGGVWGDQGSEPTRSIVNRIGFTVFHSHNGPLELTMRLGLVGLAIGLWMAWSVFRNAWWLQRARNDIGRWVVAIMVLMLITWTSENTMTGEWLGLLAMMTALTRRVRADVSATPAPDPWPVRPRVL